MPGARVKSGELVSLRTAEAEDVSFLQRGWANPEIRHLAGMQPMDLDTLERARSSGNHYMICLDGEDADAGQPDEENVTRVGWIWIDNEELNENRPDLAVFVVPEHQGNGYSKEALSLTIEYLFRAYDHPAIGGETLENNVRSQRLVETLGFTQEGRLRKYTYSDGEYRDMVQWGLLRSEWEEREEP